MAEMTGQYDQNALQSDVEKANAQLTQDINSIYEQRKSAITKGLTPEEQAKVDADVAAARTRYEQAVRGISGAFAFASQQADVLAKQSQAAQQAAVQSVLEATRQQLGRVGETYQPMTAGGLVSPELADTREFVRQTGAAGLAFQAGEEVGAAAGARPTPFSGMPSTTFAGQEISAGMGQTGRLRVSADIYQNALRAAEASGLSRAESEGAAAEVAIRAAAQDEALRRYTQQLQDIENARVAGLTQAAQFGAQARLGVSQNLFQASENELNRRADQISQERQFANQADRDRLDREFQAIQAEKNRRNAITLQSMQDRAAAQRARISSGAAAPTALEATGAFYDLGLQTRLGAFLPLAAGTLSANQRINIPGKGGALVPVNVNVSDVIYNATVAAGSAAGLPASQRRAAVSKYLNELSKNPAEKAVLASLLGKDPNKLTIDDMLQWTETSRDFTGPTASSKKKKK